MRPVHRSARWAALAIVGVIALAPVAAPAVFSAAPVVTAGVTAATISAPTGFTATAASGTTATLSWTAPPALTGYTLSQTPGTLAGCSATPSGTSCTATGLTSGTAYTWTLKAAYNNWLSSAVQASATTSAAAGFTLLGNATDGTSGTQSSSVTGVTSTSGAVMIILIYRQGSNGNLGVSSVSGSAISGTPAAINSKVFSSNSKYEVYGYRADGTGTANGTVTVSFANGNNVSTTIDVVQLSGENTSGPVARSAVSASSSAGTTVTGGSLTGASSSDGELFFVGLDTTRSMSTPTGYIALDVPASTVHGSWYSTSASATGITTTLGASSSWATIEIEIAHS
jgi:hypothetical protein